MPDLLINKLLAGNFILRFIFPTQYFLQQFLSIPSRSNASYLTIAKRDF